MKNGYTEHFDPIWAPPDPRKHWDIFTPQYRAVLEQQLKEKEQVARKKQDAFFELLKHNELRLAEQRKGT